jgi:hypothetical protein
MLARFSVVFPPASHPHPLFARYDGGLPKQPGMMASAPQRSSGKAAASHPLAAPPRALRRSGSGQASSFSPARSVSGSLGAAVATEELVQVEKVAATVVRCPTQQRVLRATLLDHGNRLWPCSLLWGVARQSAMPF